MLDSIEPYQFIFIQKSSPRKGDVFDFAYIYKFFTDGTHKSQRIKYIIRAESHDSVFAIKFYAARDKQLDYEYNKNLQIYNYTGALRIFLTCAYILPEILAKHPNASFVINGARSIDSCNMIEDQANNQRFRIYKYISSLIIANEKFEHFEFKEISSYLLVNKNCGNINKKKDEIKEMFLNRYDIDL